MVLWFTGLSGSGKTAIAEKVSEYLKTKNKKLIWLDGDYIRSKVQNNNFSQEARNQHQKYVAWTASELSKLCDVVIVSTISPKQSHRDFARNLCSEAGSKFYEIWVYAETALIQKRDAKGLYKAKAEGILNYQIPENSDIIVNGSFELTSWNVEQIINLFKEKIEGF